MRILIAPDKFKGSLSAREVADHIATGLRDRLPDAIIRKLPIADGGEGTAEVIGEARGGEWVTCAAHDALGRAIQARYVWLRQSATAVMEMSAAAGLWRITTDERDLLNANTYGVGEMIKDAANRGAKEILLGLGGSATNDGGTGMARALGFRFYKSNSVFDWLRARLRGERLDAPELNGPISDLQMLERIKPPESLSLPKIIAPADVRNPLHGPRGATHTFGSQKGGTAEQLKVLEIALIRLADIAETDLDCDFRDVAGAGAAGGLGFGLMTFCRAQIKPGFDVVARFVGLRAAVEESDIVITGEGRLDEQTLEGKAPAGVAKLARELGKRVFAIAGSSSEAPALRDQFEVIVTLARPPITAEESVARAPSLLQERARELAGMM